ncbi:TonB-dependent receptor plug domain-containing protein [Marinifilum fragile]|uniref:TonB-dependent receptor plug domain-containing protein n=1 Tax=Marinifilum fragile TaxID=570161 RepID=UPI002AA82F4C|nr:TonB-dependent receptor plug domain-containing protein [Marinifilum fragile]
MNSFSIYKLVDALGWALLHSVWQIVIFGLIVWILFRFISKDNAKLRYGVASLALAFIFVSFAITFFHYLPLSNHSNGSDLSLNPELLLYLLNGSPETLNQFSFENLHIDRYFPVMVNIWIIGVCILSCHMTFNYLQTIKLRKHLAYPVSKQTQIIADKLIQKLNLKQNITVLESGYVQTPSLVGYFKPMILLPISMLSGIPENQLEIIIAHELAHIKRHDYLFQFIQGIIELLFFYHPVVWWLSSVVNTEREHICDDLAVKICGESLTLIKALNNMEAIRKKRFELVLGLSGKKNNLFNRVQRIVRQNPSAKKTNKIVFSGLFVLLLSGFILISNFAISGNAFTGKQFFSKINVLDQNQQNGSDAMLLAPDKKKKKSRQNKKTNETHESTEIVEVESEIEDVVEIAPEIEVESLTEVNSEEEVSMDFDVDFAFPQDSLKSKEWLQKKVNEIIKEQKIELEKAAQELQDVKVEMNFDKMRLEMENALKDLDVEQIKKEMQEQQAELRKELEELTSQNLIKQLELEKELQKEELSNELKEIESDKKLNEKEKAEIKKRIQETIEKVNSKEFKEQLKKNIERSKKSLQEHLEKMESGEFEKQLQKQRESIKKQIEKFNSPKYQMELQEKLERSRESIQKHLEKLNTPEYRKELEEQIKQEKNNTDQSFRIKGFYEGENLLIVLDGKVIDKNTFKSLEPSTINSIEILKDKNATDLYGEKASNGAIIINTIENKRKTAHLVQVKGVSGEKNPLFILDGKPVDYEQFKKIDSSSYKSVTVLKDESATALYGKAAENGVVLVTSKGESDEMSNQFRLENFSGKDAPLFIVDGKKTTIKALNKLSQNDIESVTVLKDKSAIEQFGENGKNGVVLVSLKNKEDVDNTSIKIKGKLRKNSPIYVVDGKIISGKEMDFIKSKDIESINVLKDKSAIDKYGEKGKQGAIEITLKK